MSENFPMTSGVFIPYMFRLLSAGTLILALEHMYIRCGSLISVWNPTSDRVYWSSGSDENAFEHFVPLPVSIRGQDISSGLGPGK